MPVQARPPVNPHAKKRKTTQTDPEDTDEVINIDDLPVSEGSFYVGRPRRSIVPPPPCEMPPGPS